MFQIPPENVLHSTDTSNARYSCIAAAAGTRISHSLSSKKIIVYFAHYLCYHINITSLLDLTLITCQILPTAARSEARWLHVIDPPRGPINSLFCLELVYYLIQLSAN